MRKLINTWRYQRACYVAERLVRGERVHPPVVVQLALITAALAVVVVLS